MHSLNFRYATTYNARYSRRGQTGVSASPIRRLWWDVSTARSSSARSSRHAGRAIEQQGQTLFEGLTRSTRQLARQPLRNLGDTLERVLLVLAVLLQQRLGVT